MEMGRKIAPNPKKNAILGTKVTKIARKREKNE